MKRLAAWARAHRAGLALAVLFAAALFLRLWGTSSAYQRIDDVPTATQIRSMVMGDWTPDPLLMYPVFFGYIVAALLRVVSGVLRLIGLHKGPEPFLFTIDQILLAGRAVSAFLGALTVLLVHRIGRAAGLGAKALWAAFALAFSFIHILYSHQIVLDVPMTFFYVAALYFALRVLQDGRWSQYLAAAVLAGLATATKYNGIFVVLSIALAHFWRAGRARVKAWRAVLDPKLAAAAFASLAGFFAGHPFALLWFRGFLRSSRSLAALVHETEWYLTPIKPATLLERLRESKYLKAVWNVGLAEGWIFFGLAVLGLAWLVRRRGKETGFLALSGGFYFFGALGFLGFSRWRDLSTLAPFLAFLAAFGLAFLSASLGRSRAGRAAFAVLAIGAAAAFAGRSIAATYVLWQDDTTEIAGRWAERNLPPGSVIGREWFTPETFAPSSRFAAFTRPNLWYDDYPPFSRFEAVMTSSASSGHFLRYRRYYGPQAAVYDRLRLGQERLKLFASREIEFKNPTIGLYSGRYPARRKERLALPAASPPANPVREFQSLDGSPYEKDIGAFHLAAGETIIRFFSGPALPGRVAVAGRADPPESPAPSGAAAGTKISVRGRGRTRFLEVRPGAPAILILEPGRAFPLAGGLSRIEIAAPAGFPGAWIRLCTDEFAIGRELFAAGRFAEALEAFEAARLRRPPGTRDLVLYLYLARAAARAGRPDAEKAYLSQAAADDALPRLLRMRRALDGDDWILPFEKLSGLHVPLWEAVQSVELQDGDLGFRDAIRRQAEALSDGRGVEAPASGGEAAGESAFLRLAPLACRVKLLFRPSAGGAGPAGTLEIVAKAAGGSEELHAFPIDLPAPGADGFSGAVAPFVVPEGREIRFRIRLSPGTGAVFDRLVLTPDLRAFVRAELGPFDDYLVRLGL